MLPLFDSSIQQPPSGLKNGCASCTNTEKANLGLQQAYSLKRWNRWIGKKHSYSVEVNKEKEELI